MAVRLQHCSGVDRDSDPLVRRDPHDLARRYVALLLRAERAEAVDLVLAAAGELPLETIYVNVLQEAQYEIGRLWERNEISIAQEHYCTAVTQLVLSLLYPRAMATPRNGRTFAGACVEGELHEVGIRFVSDVFELRGWRNMYLGSSLPAGDLIAFVEQSRPDVLGISAVRDVNVPAVRDLVHTLRSRLVKVPLILVGGRPFNLQSDLWREVAADGTARNAAESVEVAVRLLELNGNTT